MSSFYDPSTFLAFLISFSFLITFRLHQNVFFVLCFHLPPSVFITSCCFSISIIIIFSCRRSTSRNSSSITTRFFFNVSAPVSEYFSMFSQTCPVCLKFSSRFMYFPASYEVLWSYGVLGGLCIRGFLWHLCEFMSVGFVIGPNAVGVLVLLCCLAVYLSKHFVNPHVQKCYTNQ